MTELEEKQVPKKEQYSFSKLSTWWQCRYSYFQKYIEHKAGIGNAFSSYGSLVHSILERYAKKEIELWDMPSIYEWEFDSAVPEKFPWNKYKVLRDSYYEEGLNFLKNFNGYEKCKILGIEQEFEIEIDDWNLVGFIDVVFVDESGKLIVRDYKSKASFKNETEKKEYARQPYLYSLYVKEKYGRYPDEIQFLMFRKENVERIKFNEEDLQEAISWAKDTVADIRACVDYPPAKTVCNDFYAQNLCNHREYCEFSAFKK